MSTNYKVIDLTDFYWLFPRDKAYLILHTSDKQEKIYSRKSEYQADVSLTLSIAKIKKYSCS